MPRGPSFFRAGAFLAVIGGGFAASAQATTYVRMADEDLADGAPSIAVVRVLRVARAQDVAATDYVVQPERRLKGDLPDEVTVRVPGGAGPNGWRFRIAAAPAFVVGERALLFVGRHEDGTYRILHFMLGAFHEAESEGRRLAVRRLSAAHEVGAQAGKPEPAREFDRFADWLERRSRGEEPEQDYRVMGGAPPVPPETGPTMLASAPVSEAFTLLGDGRWVSFDTGARVGWAARSTGVAGMSGGGYAEFVRALQAWNDDPSTPVSLSYEGTTAARGGLQAADGVSAILFDDPSGELEGSFTCGQGGMLALGGWWESPATVTFNGRTFWVIAEGDIVTQDGAGCFFAGNGGRNGEETFGHELGHTLGLGHSCAKGTCVPGTPEDDALMRWSVHGDGRGARLGTDDRKGLRVLYQPVTVGVAGVTVPEGDLGTSDAVFLVTLSAAAAQAVTVAYSTADETATAGTDYGATSGILTFSPGTTQLTVDVPVLGNMQIEPDETFLLRLGETTGASVSVAQARGAIRNDDVTAISIDDRTVTEGSAANAAFRVTLSAPRAQTVTVAYSTLDGTALAGSDYVSTAGVLTFTPGRTMHSLFVPLLADAVPEAPETFTVALSSAVTIADGSAVATIREDPGGLSPRLPMYRAFNASRDYHFFTTDPASRDYAVGTLHYRDESDPIPFYVLRAQAAGAVPLFRMYNPNLGRHCYTADAASRDELMKVGMVYDRDEGFVYPGPAAGATELFRLYNNNSGTHLFTADPVQKDAILAMFPGVWVAHTSVGYVFSAP